MLKFITNRTDVENELLNEIKLFFYDLDVEITVEHDFCSDGNFCENKLTINNNLYRYVFNYSENNVISRQKFFDRAAKKSVYCALKEYTGKSMPWGSLTGIRPTKIAYEYLASGGSVDTISQYLQNEYEVSKEKANLIKRIIQAQVGYYEKDEKFYNFYAHIPYCTSKCSYCSFTTFDVSRWAKSISQYTDLLQKEIITAFDFRNRNGYIPYSFYVGGGTPTALPDVEFEKMLSSINSYGKEFTCEAGRPDTITEDKLRIMKDYGVTRVCVNPQSFLDNTLKIIGRNHTIADFYDKYEMVKKYGFDINIDLIAGLPNENVDDFAYSVNCALNLKPDNLTIHTLSRKNGSTLKNNGKYDNSSIEEMIKYSSEVVENNGYLPYYLYRQKSMLGNLENVGYTLDGKQCINNITTMEEFLSVEGCGAGAISKRVFGGGERIERLANVRDIKLYIEQFEERLIKKEIFNAK